MLSMSLEPFAGSRNRVGLKAQRISLSVSTRGGLIGEGLQLPVLAERKKEENGADRWDESHGVERPDVDVRYGKYARNETDKTEQARATWRV